MERIQLLLRRFGPVRLTGRGVAFLVVAFIGLIAAYAAGWPALLAVSLFLAGAVAAAVLVVAAAPSEIAVERRIDSMVVEQRRAVLVRVSVHGAALGSLDWVEELPRSVTVSGRAEGHLDGLRQGASAALLEYSFSSRVRGEVPIGPLRVVRTDPLALATVQRRVGGVDRVVVLPAIHAVAPPVAIRRTDPDPRASAAFGAVGDQRDIVARGYRPGDPLRSVDWRATAHRGELMVRSEAAASTSSAGLVLDTRQQAWPQAAAFEWAVEYAASLVQALDDRGAAVRSSTGVRVADDGLAALIDLAVVARRAAVPAPDALVPAVAQGEVHVVQVVTGDGDLAPLLRLPALPHGATGIVAVVSQRSASVEVPLGWRAISLDPTRPVGKAAGA